MDDLAEQRRQQARERSEAYRNRLRHRRVLVSIEVEPDDCAALERLALLPVGNRDREAIGHAVARLLNAAAGIASIGDALWPAKEDRGARDDVSHKQSVL